VHDGCEESLRPRFRGVAAWPEAVSPTLWLFRAWFFCSVDNQCGCGYNSPK
jgi:hypothetical protein